MPKTIEITMTPVGFEIRIGADTLTFKHLDGAVDFARGRFERAQEIRDLTGRID
jgi:hypothetical protein